MKGSRRIVRDPAVLGQLLCFQSSGWLWLVNLNDPNRSCLQLIDLKGVNSWRLYGEAECPRLLWTKTKSNQTEVWSARIQATGLGKASQLLVGGPEKLLPGCSLQPQGSLIYLKRTDRSGVSPRTLVSGYALEAGLLQLRENWDHTDGIYQLKTAEANLESAALLLSQHCSQSWRPIQYRGGQRSKLHLFTKTPDNSSPALKNVDNLPYSRIWGLSILRQTVYFCAKASSAPSVQLFSATIRPTSQGYELSDTTQITPANLAADGIQGYCLSHTPDLGSIAILEQLGQFYLLSSQTTQKTDFIGADLLVLEFPSDFAPTVTEPESHDAWLDELRVRFFNPSIQNDHFLPLRQLQELVPGSKSDIQWLRRQMAYTLQSSHCRYQGQRDASIESGIDFVRNIPRAKRYEENPAARGGASLDSGIDFVRNLPRAKRYEENPAARGGASLDSGIDFVRNIPRGKRLRYLHLSEAESLDDIELEGLILDLRGHPGGNRSQHILTKLGLSFQQPVAWQTDREGNEIAYPPLAQICAMGVANAAAAWVVLIDEYTRSDSELLAHAIRFWRGPRVWPKLIGSRTAGDGLGYSRPIRLTGDISATVPEFALKLNQSDSSQRQFWLENQGIEPCLSVSVPPGLVTLGGPENSDRVLEIAIETLAAAFREAICRENRSEIK